MVCLLIGLALIGGVWYLIKRNRRRERGEPDRHVSFLDFSSLLSHRFSSKSPKSGTPPDPCQQAKAPQVVYVIQRMPDLPIEKPMIEKEEVVDFPRRPNPVPIHPYGRVKAEFSAFDARDLPAPIRNATLRLKSFNSFLPSLTDSSGESDKRPASLIVNVPKPSKETLEVETEDAATFTPRTPDFTQTLMIMPQPPSSPSFPENAATSPSNYFSTQRHSASARLSRWGNDLLPNAPSNVMQSVSNRMSQIQIPNVLNRQSFPRLSSFKGRRASTVETKPVIMYPFITPSDRDDIAATPSSADSSTPLKPRRRPPPRHSLVPEDLEKEKE